MFNKFHVIYENIWRQYGGKKRKTFFEKTQKITFLFIFSYCSNKIHVIFEKMKSIWKQCAGQEKHFSKFGQKDT